VWHLGAAQKLAKFLGLIIDEVLGRGIGRTGSVPLPLWLSMFGNANITLRCDIVWAEHFFELLRNQSLSGLFYL
jgi:hypothetical protein